MLLSRAFSTGRVYYFDFLGLRPISASLRLWDGSLPQRGRRTQPGVLTPGAQPIKRLALKGPKV